MTTAKMTRVQALNIAIDGMNDCEAREVLLHMREQFEKPKASTPAKSKARIENEHIAHKLYETVSDVPFDSKFVMEHTTALTPQKVVGIMKVGIALGLFERLKDGKRTVYRKL